MKIRNQQRKSMKPKAGSFEKINKIDKAVAKVSKKKKREREQKLLTSQVKERTPLYIPPTLKDNERIL